MDKTCLSTEIHSELVDVHDGLMSVSCQKIVHKSLKMVSDCTGQHSRSDRCEFTMSGGTATVK
jgi:hypothetical protein